MAGERMRDEKGRFVKMDGGTSGLGGGALRGALSARQGRQDVKLRWFQREMERNTRKALSPRIRLACQILRDRVVSNISVPVVKVRKKLTRGPRVGQTVTVVVERSKPGEYPRADTTQLMKTTFWEMRDELTGIVGTPLDYGVVLETKMDRSWLRRTLNEQEGTLRRIIVGRPVK